MTTPTTNYGWLKPNPTEPADIRVINTLLDAMDTSIKSVENTLQSNIYKAAQYRVKRKFTYSDDGFTAYPVSAPDTQDLWEEFWVTDKYNAGEWTFPASGLLRFTAAGIYKITFNYTIPTYGSTTTSGTVSIGLHNTGTTNQVRRTKTYIRSNTCDNVTNFQRTTCQGAFYVWAGAGSDQCALNTDYDFRVQTMSSAGAVNMIVSVTDLLPFRPQLTIECVRKLAS